ncbi:ependymin-related protein 1 [Patella vulgata]|uniref:ependymin-related protein 1 n=1 Tax=Patella vulgata TaxID=6465 RepID=UPI0021802140|nr:ependymin-related protein 1 [Patella vulgata]
MLALGFLLLVAYAESADPTKCCVDREFEAYLDEAGSYFTPQDKEFHPIKGFTTIAYDFYSKRMNLRVHNTLENGTVINSNLLFDYANQIEYAIYKGICTAHKYHVPMRQPCIPANATYDGPLTMGYGSNTLKLETWKYPISELNSDVKLSISQDGCVPVVESIYIKGKNGADTDIIYIISNFTPGIKNRGRLEIPTKCIGVVPKDTLIIG